MDNKTGVSDPSKIRIYTIEDINSFKPLHLVLVEITKLMHESIKYGSLELFVNNSFETVAHSIRTGTVAKLPIVPLRIGNGRSFTPWKTTLEIEVGDTILFSYDGAVRVLHGTDYLYVYQDRLFLLIPYSDIAMCKHNDVIKPVNGYIIMEPFDLEQEDKILNYGQFIHTPESIKRIYSDKIATIRYLPDSQIDEYYGVPQACDSYELKVGDVVVYRPKTDVQLEDELHNDFLPIKGMFKIQGRYLLLKLE